MMMQSNFADPQKLANAAQTVQDMQAPPEMVEAAQAQQAIEEPLPEDDF
jgi:hypothetical protein